MDPYEVPADVEFAEYGDDGSIADRVAVGMLSGPAIEGVAVEERDESVVVAGRGLTEAPEYLPATPAPATAAIVPTAFGPHVNAVAAASLVIDRVFRDPLGVRVPR